jgi:5-methylcytosine-specific restriction endonuclease McrA
MSSNGGRTGPAYRALVDQVRRDEPTRCWLCPRPIDTTARAPHPDSWSLDHVVPIAAGGSLLDRGNARAAHLGCNTARKDRPATPVTSRRWLD